MNPRVSVVIPTYNRAIFIAECLDSVLAQTYRDFEVIVVDDGSTDNTDEVLKPYLGSIRLIKQGNSGSAAARNNGIGEAKGEYIAFQDSDDIWMPDKLEKQMIYLEENPHFDLICGNGISFGKGEKAGRLVVRKKRLHAIEKEGVTLRNTYMKGCLFPSTWVVKKKVMEKLGGFDSSLPVSMDWDFDLRFLLKGYKAAFVNDVFFRRRKHPGNVSSIKERQLLHIIRITDKLLSNNPEARKIIGEKLLNRKMSSTYYQLGKVYYGKGQRKQASDAFKKALAFRAIYPSCLFYFFMSKAVAGDESES